LIIGAGISGLSFAVRKKDEDYLVLERDLVVGGLCQSFKDSGFVWDVAGHFFHFHSDDTKRYYEQLMNGRIQCLATKCAKVYYGGKYMDAPFQYNIHQLPMNEFIECLTGLYYADCKEGNVFFDEYVRKKFGNGIADKFLIPYNEKLYACKMNELECDSMGVYLPKLDFGMLMDFYRGERGRTYNDTFCYPINGCEEIINALLERLDKDRIHLNEEAILIDTDKKIVHTKNETYEYEYLINTSPLPDFASMSGCGGMEVLTHNKVLVFNIGFDRPSIDKQVSWVYYPGDEIFYRVGFYNNIASTDRLSVYVEIGYRAEDKIDVDDAFRQTLADLKRVNIISEHQVVAHMPYIITPGYVHITSEGKEYVDKLICKMERRNVFMVGRYARWEYSAMDNSLEQAAELANRI
jgi:protoporphyrinogen oxidase